jgi:hypothetical protein
MSDAVQFTSKYKDNNIDVANPEWKLFCRCCKQHQF